MVIDISKVEKSELNKMDSVSTIRMIVEMENDQESTWDMTRISNLLNISTAASTGVVKRSVKKGYIVRNKGVEDARRREIKLTSQGRIYAYRLRNSWEHEDDPILIDLNEVKQYESGKTHAFKTILMLIALNHEDLSGLSFGEISKLIESTPQSLSNMILFSEQRGFVKRSKGSPGPRKSLSITAKGSEYIKRVVVPN